MFAGSIALFTGSSHTNPTIWQVLFPEIATPTACKLLFHLAGKWGELKQRKDMCQIRTLICSWLGNFNLSDMKNMQFASLVFGGLLWVFFLFVCLFICFFFSHKTWGRASVRRLCFSRSDPSYCPASESLTVKCTSSFGSQLPISLTLCCAMSLILFSIVFLVLRLFYYLKLN